VEFSKPENQVWNQRPEKIVGRRNLKMKRNIPVIAGLLVICLLIAPLAAFTFPKGSSFQSYYLSGSVSKIPNTTPIVTVIPTKTPVVTLTKIPVVTRTKTTFVTPTRTPVVTPTPTATPNSSGSTPFRDRFGSLLKAGSPQKAVTPSTKTFPPLNDPGWSSSGGIPAGWKYDPDNQMLYPPGWEEWQTDPANPWIIDSTGKPGSTGGGQTVWS
jgi:hypothetical protein